MSRIVKKGLEGSYVVGKIYQTTVSIGFYTCQDQNLKRLGYFGEISPLNAPSDPLVSKLKFQELLKRAGRVLMLLAKLIKSLCLSV